MRRHYVSDPVLWAVGIADTIIIILLAIVLWLQVAENRRLKAESAAMETMLVEYYDANGWDSYELEGDVKIIVERR